MTCVIREQVIMQILSAYNRLTRGRGELGILCLFIKQFQNKCEGHIISFSVVNI